MWERDRPAKRRLRGWKLIRGLAGFWRVNEQETNLSEVDLIDFWFVQNVLTLNYATSSALMCSAPRMKLFYQFILIHTEDVGRCKRHRHQCSCKKFVPLPPPLPHSPCLANAGPHSPSLLQSVKEHEALALLLFGVRLVHKK